MLLGLLVGLVVVTGGMSAGVLMGTVLGGMPLLRVLPLPRYVHAHGFFATRYDPFMPICLLLTAAGDIALAAVAPVPAAAACFAAGAFCAVAVSAISLRYNAPVNRRMARTDPDDLPDDFVDPRRDWFRWNRIRSGFAVAALVLTALGVGLLTATA